MVSASVRINQPDLTALKQILLTCPLPAVPRWEAELGHQELMKLLRACYRSKVDLYFIRYRHHSVFHTGHGRKCRLLAVPRHRIKRLLRCPHLEKVAPPVHEPTSILQIGRPVVGRSHLLTLSMCQLPLDHIGVPPSLVGTG